MNVEFRMGETTTPALLVSILPNPDRSPWIVLERGDQGNGRSTFVVAPAPKEQALPDAPPGAAVVALPALKGPSQPRGPEGVASNDSNGVLRLGDVFAFANGFPRIDWELMQQGPDAEELALLRYHYGDSFRWVPTSEFDSLHSALEMGSTLGIYRSFQSIRRARENGVRFLTARERASYDDLCRMESRMRGGRPLTGAEEADVLRSIVTHSYLRTRYRDDFSPSEIASLTPTEAERKQFGPKESWQDDYRKWVEKLRRKGETHHYLSFDEWYSRKYLDMKDNILAARLRDRSAGGTTSRGNALEGASGATESGARPTRLPISLKVFKSADYPFEPEHFAIAVRETDGSWTRYPGRVTGIYYGFTPHTLEEYQANNDVPWFNAQGEAVADGLLVPNIHHQGGYEGSWVMDPLTVEVPKGMNLVFKLRVEKFDGKGFPDSDTQHLDSFQTKTYFVDASEVEM